VNDAPPPYGTVVFDCDSTLSAVEGVDELARLAGIDVGDLTRRAMEGALRLEDVYTRRLERIRPTRAMLARLGALYVERALPHAADLVRALQALDKRVCIVSGGLLPAVGALADALGVPPGDVFAVAVEHAADGTWAGFDARSPLARSGGKPEVLRALAARPGAGAVCLVGDGVTDLEAAPAAARFVAFAGVERRASVVARAAVRCEAADLAALVPLLLAPDEIARLTGLPQHAGLVRAAPPFSTTVPDP
jgi:phosphoserine phosphatase